MKRIILITLLLMEKMAFSQVVGADIASTIISLERSALEKWNQGDPSGYLDLSAEDVTYFDPSLEQRLEGLEALKKYYEPVKGLVNVSRYEMINPKVVAVSEMAVLTFNLHSYKGDEVYKWNCTEVYRLEQDNQWKIVQTHWSFVRPQL